jgi:valyl-tRNA synthetase
MLENLSKTYDPKEFEDKLYKFWSENGYFTPKVDKTKKPYTIMMPPPNVTGSLHMGHALNNTIQDILIRWKRMEGYEALWLPGTDHASISTEAKVV